jgi:molybdopterin-binding protein
LRVSARNILKGEIVDITKGVTTSHVKIDIGGGTIITAAITNAAADELGLAPGRKAYALVNASDVMVGVD